MLTCLFTQCCIITFSLTAALFPQFTLHLVFFATEKFNIQNKTALLWFKGRNATIDGLLTSNNVQALEIDFYCPLKNGNNWQQNSFKLLWKIVTNNYMQFGIKLVKHAKTAVCAHTVLWGMCPHADRSWSVAYVWFTLMTEAAAVLHAMGEEVVCVVSWDVLETVEYPTNISSPFLYCS